VENPWIKIIDSVAGRMGEKKTSNSQQAMANFSRGGLATFLRREIMCLSKSPSRSPFIKIQQAKTSVKLYEI
jgi:hypothetical protein